MIRFFVIVTAFAVMTSAAAAQQSRVTLERGSVNALSGPPCGSVETAEADQVLVENDNNYRTVPVILEIDVPQQFKDKPLRRPTGAFVVGLKTSDERIKLDKSQLMLWVSRCSEDVRQNKKFYASGTTWFLVHGPQVKEGSRITVTGKLVLPDDVADAEPVAFTVAADDRVYIGKWEATNDGDQIVLRAQ